MLWDVFISHAVEDKADVARPLADLLATKGLLVWLDENEVALGDSLREKIDAGLAQSRFGVVILSSSFFGKKWTNSELNSLVALETRKRKVILPIWHGVDHTHVSRYSPLLADKRAISTSMGLDRVASEILAVVAWADRGKPKLHDGPVATPESVRGADYLELNADPENASAEISFRELREQEEATAKPEQFAAIASSCWPAAFDLLATLIGLRRSDFMLGRTHVYPQKYSNGGTRYIVRRTADGVQSRFEEWEVMSALIHFRNWHLLRDIDRDAVDLYVAVEEKFDFDRYVPRVHSDKVLAKLTNLKPLISRALVPVVAWATGEKQVKITLRDPVWREDSMPVNGGDAYRFRGMITGVSRVARR